MQAELMLCFAVYFSSTYFEIARPKCIDIQRYIISQIKSLNFKYYSEAIRVLKKVFE